MLEVVKSELVTYKHGSLSGSGAVLHLEGACMGAEQSDRGFGSVCLIRDQLTVGTGRILCVLGTLYHPLSAGNY